MQTLVAFQAFVAEKYAPKTAKMYFGDVRELSIYLKNKKLQEISSHDLQQWIGSLVSPAGKGIERKTVNRKVSAIITYFLWLRGLGAITRDPTLSLNNARIQSPLPDYLYENEIETPDKSGVQTPGCTCWFYCFWIPVSKVMSYSSSPKRMSISQTPIIRSCGSNTPGNKRQRIAKLRCRRDLRPSIPNTLKNIRLKTNYFPLRIGFCG